MSTRHFVDPELLPALEASPSFVFSAETLPLIRQSFAEIYGQAPDTGHPNVETTETEIRGPEGHPLRLLIHRPRALSAKRPAVLHIHGGGYVLGSPEISTNANQMLANEADCVVVSVDYRLAPETAHPGPVEDCYAGLKWLNDNAVSLGVDPARIAVAGESAGGGLAAGLAILARDRGEIALFHQHLIYPMIDDRTCTRAPNPMTGEFIWTPASNHFGWASLLGAEPGSDGVSPYAAAARADDLHGLPSTFIYVGALDLFVDENIIYAMRLISACVPTELHVFPGAFHGFEAEQDAAVTKTAMRLSIDALRRALHR